MPLDEIDHLLLDLVQTDARRPLHALGDAGVIRAETAVLDPEAVGRV